MKKYIRKNQKANKRCFDARLEIPTFKEKDLVLVERKEFVKGACSKLLCSYIGPYQIRRKLNYEIAFLRGRSGGFVIHAYQGNVADELVDPNYVPFEPNSGDTSDQPVAHIDQDSPPVNADEDSFSEISSSPFGEFTPNATTLVERALSPFPCDATSDTPRRQHPVTR